MRVLQIIRKEWMILLIIAFAFFLRIWKLDLQSLWVDELHNMLEADPGLSWRDLFFALKHSDPHPPLYYIAERLCFSVFGHTAFVARMVSVLAGTASVWAMWLLGREMLNRRLGHILAVITCVNYYNLYYSQEARGYIFVFLFAALSTVYLVRMIKAPGRKQIILYIISALCLLYTHYFSLFLIIAHGVTGLIMLVVERTAAERIRLFRRLLAAFVVVGVGYLPWLPFFKAVSRIRSFWIKPIAPDFVQTFFFEYFGNPGLLKPLLILLPVIYLVHVSLDMKKDASVKLKDNPLLLSFMVVSCTLFISYIIPYVRSLLATPMLYARYTIIVLPVILLTLAYGIESFRSKPVKILILSAFTVCSLVHIVWAKKYYSRPWKTQFRELTAYIVHYNHRNYPVLSEKTSWHQSYYFRKLKSDVRQLSGPKARMVDSILYSRNPEWALDGFWIAGAHEDPMLDEAKLLELQDRYVLVRQKTFYDAWAQLFVLKKLAGERFHAIDYRSFKPAKNSSVMEREQVLGIWSGYVETRPFRLSRGNYRVTVSAKGTDLQGEFPQVHVLINGKRIGSCYVDDRIHDTVFRFRLPEDSRAVLSVGFDNDKSIEREGDINLLLQSVVIEKI